MTTRQRILAILDGKAPDRIPWIPRLQIWYDAHLAAGTLPDEYRDCSLRQVEQDVFGGTAARDGVIWRAEIRDVEIRTHRPNDMETVTEYVTPAGTVTTRFSTTECLRRNAIQDAQVEFMIKRPEDYAAVEYIIEHTDYVPAFD